ncbi:tyrosine-type recombinase/integrase [Zooshikella marina]|uniref:tyrosine-type recombinase/integrase n=1 Tax=Zooshikella ganghwensis TaxID=202772 RepID=UPI001BAF7380|nr:phage integrase Arm DNA-binding domain-containing protein [Zooshikella ganghwensis]MBU2709213.1 tyrosine-type recombinase/integrase [Zooshikella ganghwensis]
MTPRKRSHKNKGLEPNLYTYGANNKYYRYRHPRTGKYFPMGSDRAKAQTAARLLNSRLAEHNFLVERVVDDHRTNLAFLIERFKEEYLPLRNLKARSRDNTLYRLGRVERDIGGRALDELTVQFIADYLDLNFTGDSYRQHRSILVQLCRFAITKGLMDNNPAEVTLNKQVQKKRRRLTLKQYHAIYAHAEPWLRNAMDLSLITLQRAGDVCKLKFEDIHDGKMFVIQEKTEKHGESAYLAITLNPLLNTIIDRAKQSGIHSPHVVHRESLSRINQTKRNHHHTAVRRDFLSRAFTKTRDMTSLFNGIDPSERPTFHEIRSLGGYLYEQQGFEKSYIRKLMGHTSEKMTNVYLDGHENRWTECNADLPIQLLKMKPDM